ncbi:MAG TPA: hypothetical protein VFW87_21025 [Pirellulales bacterium]|nr:hypothetical protein [Pirellulales bacterium]
MWLRCKYPWLAGILIAGVSTLAGGAFAEEEPAPAELAAPASREADSLAPRHRINQALIDQRPRCDARTLGDMLRHLGCDQDACPLCGKPCSAGEDDAQDRGASRSPPSKPPFIQRFFACDGDSGGDAEFSSERKAADLRRGEPAQVIIDLKRRLGRDVYEGTQFGGSPEVLVDWIRALDEESRRQPSETDADEPASDTSIVAPSRPATDAAIEIDALRKAARKLGEAADLLEEQNLFDTADEVRSVSDELRLRARERVSGSK